jgi:hypothetical protein
MNNSDLIKHEIFFTVKNELTYTSNYLFGVILI